MPRFHRKFTELTGRRPLWLASLLILIAFPPAIVAEEKSEKSDDSQFVRLLRDAEDEPVSLDTAIVSYHADEGPFAGSTVDLIGAIHVGDKGYYKKLNDRFRRYDAVLYELVAPTDANVPRPGTTPGSAIGGMQVGMKSLLELEYQLDCINYGAKNMVHADMSPAEFAASMKARDESFMAMFFRMMGRSFAEQSKDPIGGSDWQVLSAFFAEDRAHRLKRVMAEQFADLEAGLQPFEGPSGSTIITERNKKALDILKRELKAGQKKVAVFYGAGHLPDMERRLLDDFGMKRGETTWVEAWSLERKPAKASGGGNESDNTDGAEDN